MPTKTVRRPWALRLAGVMSLLVLGWTFSPQLLSFFADKDKDKDKNLPPELAVVPPEAFVFMHARPAEIWDHETIAKLREFLKEHKKEFGNEFPVNPSEVESMSLVVVTAQTMAIFPGFRPTERSKPETTERPPEAKVKKDDLEKKKVDEPKKGDVDKKKVDEPKKDDLDKKKIDEPKKDDLDKKKVDEPEPKFAVSPTTVELSGKDKEALVIARSGKIKEVKSSDGNLVHVKVDGKRVSIIQVAEAPEKEIRLDVTVTPFSGDAVKVAVLLRAADKGKKDDEKELEKKKGDAPKKGDEAKRKVSKDVHVGQIFAKTGEYAVQLKYQIKWVEPAEKDGVEALIHGGRVTFKQTVDSPPEDKEVDFIIRGVPDTVDDVKVTIILKKRGTPKDDLPKVPDKKKAVEPKAPEKKNVAEPQNEITSGIFVGKGGTLLVPFKYGKIKAVEPAEKDGVEATIEEDRVRFKQVVDAPDDKDRQLEFTIRGGPNDKDEVKVTITMKKSIIAREPARLKGDGYLYDKGTSCVVRAKFKVTSVDPDETEGVQARIDGEMSVVFKQTVDAPNSDRKVEFTIRGGPDDKQVQKVAIIVKKKFSSKDDDLPNEPQKKEPEKTRDDDKPGKTEGSQAKDDFPQPQALVVVKMKEPLGNRLSGRIISLSVGEDAKKREHNGKSYLMNAAGNCLCFLNDTTFVAATTEAVMKKALDQPEQVKASGAQAAALNLAAKKHHLVVGVNLMEPTCLEMKKRLSMELARPQFRGGDDFSFLAAPLLETQAAVVSVDLGKESRVKVEASLSFPNAEKAAAAVGSLQDALAVARIFGLGRMVQELNFGAGIAEGHRQEIFFMIAAAKQAEAALRAATFERRQSLVTFQVEGQFDIDYLRGKAKIAADNYKIDPAVRQAIYRNDSVDNLKQMTLAMHNYHDVYKFLPPHAITDKDGKPLLSWRVAILPFIEQLPLYNEFKLDEPWDSEHNIKLLPRMPRIYAPLGVKTKEPYTTFYQVFTGPDTPFEIVKSKDVNIPMGRRLGFIPDGTSNTIAIVEAGDPVIWSKPDDLPYDAKKPLPKIGGTLFADGFHCSMCDGSVRFVKPAKAGVTPEEAARRGEVSEETLRNAITCSDGMVLGPDW